MRNYRDKTVVISGAGSGIGRALALEMARRGARLALTDINGGEVQETAHRCAALGVQAESWKVDVADRAAMYQHAEDVVERFGGVDVAVNNAGVAIHARTAETSDRDFAWIMDINFWGMVHGSKAFLPHLILSGDGQLANVSSVFGLIAVAKDGAYNASKFAIRGFTEALRQEVRLDRLPVSVSCIHPGGIKTNIVNNARFGAGEDGARVAGLFDRFAVTSPEGAARSIVRGLERDRARILVGPDARLIAALPQVFGAQYGRLIEAGLRIARV
ncbi:SDR family NAD(P)-dependent oxidoreductase [Nocardia nepalensis]|uniref:SDR family NAD(P)-dependent oxidoreductase n=1 Tax=Nocardia nepalensis TaxID=3375448 RepID=UPI003B674D15